jgi:hypothetical protein
VTFIAGVPLYDAPCMIRDLEDTILSEDGPMGMKLMLFKDAV